jgi:hypothetical protein
MNLVKNWLLTAYKTYIMLLFADFPPSHKSCSLEETWQQGWAVALLSLLRG